MLVRTSGKNYSVIEWKGAQLVDDVNNVLLVLGVPLVIYQKVKPRLSLNMQGDQCRSELAPHYQA